MNYCDIETNNDKQNTLQSSDREENKRKLDLYIIAYAKDKLDSKTNKFVTKMMVNNLTLDIVIYTGAIVSVYCGKLHVNCKILKTEEKIHIFAD